MQCAASFIQPLTTAHGARVVSSEISGGKFPEIYSSLSGNFQKFVNNHYLRQSAVSKSSIAKWCCKRSMFL